MALGDALIPRRGFSTQIAASYHLIGPDPPQERWIRTSAARKLVNYVLRRNPARFVADDLRAAGRTSRGLSSIAVRRRRRGSALPFYLAENQVDRAELERRGG